MFTEYDSNTLKEHPQINMFLKVLEKARLSTQRSQYILYVNWLIKVCMLYVQWNRILMII